MNLPPHPEVTPPEPRRLAYLAAGPDVLVLEGTTPEEPWAYVKFQSGPVKEAGVNGVQIEDVLGLASSRLAVLHEAAPCIQNVHVLDHIKCAIEWLNARTAERRARGVEGTSRP